MLPIPPENAALPAPMPAAGPDRHSARRAVAREVVIVLACLGVVLAAAWTGRTARRVLPEAAVVRCRVPEDALFAWRRAGVHGRVLVHFARHVAMSPAPGPPSPNDYVARALQEGIVRRVYHVIPDGAWPEVHDTLAARPGIPRRGEAFLLQAAGAPIVVLPLEALPRLEEPALVTIEGERWSPQALGEIAASLGGPLRHDLVTWYAKSPDRVRVLEGLSRGAP